MTRLCKYSWNKVRLRLLLVEDNIILQSCLTKKLKVMGCDVVLAKSGEEAVEKFCPDFDGVLMDLGLPGISGYEATQMIRRQYPEIATPIMASTTQDASCEKACFKMGMDGLLHKPWDDKDMTNFLTDLEKKQRIKQGGYLRAV